MRRVAGWLILCALILPPLSAQAADEQGGFSVRGVGLVDCASYVKEREAGSKVYFMIGGWIDGYLTATNQRADETYSATSFESTELLASVLNAHCRKNPEDRLFSVINSLLQKLWDERIRDNSARVEFAVDGRKGVLYQEVLVRVQSQLAARGHYQGAVDGRFGDATREAIAAFQQAEGLQASGFPDQVTLWRLLRKPVS